MILLLFLRRVFIISNTIVTSIKEQLTHMLSRKLLHLGIDLAIPQIKSDETYDMYSNFQNIRFG